MTEPELNIAEYHWPEKDAARLFERLEPYTQLPNPLYLVRDSDRPTLEHPRFREYIDGLQAVAAKELWESAPPRLKRGLIVLAEGRLDALVISGAPERKDMPDVLEELSRQKRPDDDEFLLSFQKPLPPMLMDDLESLGLVRILGSKPPYENIYPDKGRFSGSSFAQQVIRGARDAFIRPYGLHQDRHVQNILSLSHPAKADIETLGARHHTLLLNEELHPNYADYSVSSGLPYPPQGSYAVTWKPGMRALINEKRVVHARYMEKLDAELPENTSAAGAVTWMNNVQITAADYARDFRMLSIGRYAQGDYGPTPPSLEILKEMGRIVPELLEKKQQSRGR